MSDHYKPVSCNVHSEYELAIMHHQTLRIKWQDSNKNLHIFSALPSNIFTHEHAEYLLVTDENDEQIEIRLDRIIESESI